jgi:hypothetical protein
VDSALFAEDMMSIASGHRQVGTTAALLRLYGRWNNKFLCFGFVVGALVATVLTSPSIAWAAEPHVILLRGWFGVFSAGLDSVADDLRAQGIDAKVTGHLHWSEEVAEILRERSTGQTGSLILVGHSQGANNVIDMARSLESYHITVDLLVTLTPFMQNPIPANVVKAINYYNSSGWGEPIAADKGSHGKLINIDLANDPTIKHTNVDKSVKVRARVLQEIIALETVANGAPVIATGR